MTIITQSCIYSPLGVLQKVSTRLVRYLGLLLIPLMSLLATNAFADASGTYEDMPWTYTSSKKTFKITGTGEITDNPCGSYDVDTLIIEGTGDGISLFDNVFANSSFVKVSLSDVNNIYESAFYGCTSLTTVNFLDVDNIYEYAFYGCTNLSTAYVSATADIDDDAFPSTTNVVKMTHIDATDEATCDKSGHSAAGWYSEDNTVYINDKNEVLDAKDYILPAKGHDFSDKILSATPNAEGLYAYVCKNDPNDLSDYTVIKGETGEQNIELTKDEDGNYSVDVLNIKDPQSLNLPVNFTAGTLTYDRLADKDTITFILPFDVPAEAVNGQVYQLKSFDGKTLTYSKLSGDVKANTPYLLLVNVKGENMISEVSNVAVKANAKTDTLTADNASQFGAYNSVVLTSDANMVYYAFQNNKFYRCNEVTVNPFRTAIVLDKTTAANGNPAPSYALKGINVVFEDGDVTGAELVNADNALTGKVNVYDVLGRAVRINVDAETCLNGLSNGVYMVNGHKFVVRNK